MLSLKYFPQSTNKECQEKGAARHLVSLESPNWSIDEDLRCSAHWGTKKFYCNASLQGVSGLYRGCAVPVAPCRSGITGWRPKCHTGAGWRGQPQLMAPGPEDIILQHKMQPTSFMFLYLIQWLKWSDPWNSLHLHIYKMSSREKSIWG